MGNNVMDNSEIKPFDIVGRGKSAVVFYRGGGIVTKKFFNSPDKEKIALDKEKVKKEFERHKFALDAGLPVPRLHSPIYTVSPLIMGEESLCYDMEFVDGLNLKKKMKGANLREREKSISKMVEIQKNIYRVAVCDKGKFDRIDDELKRYINASKYLKKCWKKPLIDLLDNLSGNSLSFCHCDFAAPNIICDVNDRYYIIDWANAKLGNPLYCMCVTYMHFYLHMHPYCDQVEHPGEEAGMSDSMNIYLQKIKEMMGINREDLFAWLPLYGAIYLSKIPAENPKAHHNKGEKLIAILNKWAEKEGLETIYTA